MQSDSNGLMKISLEFLASIGKQIDQNEIVAQVSSYMGQGMYHANIIFVLNVNSHTYKFICLNIFFGADLNDETQCFNITRETVHFKGVHIKSHDIFDMSCNDPPRLPNYQYYYVEKVVPFAHELIQWYKQLTENREHNEESYKYMKNEETLSSMVSDQTISIQKLSKIYNLI